MQPAQQYRKLAAELRAKSQYVERALLRSELNRLAKCYVRLAEQAEHNQTTDVTYEPPPASLRDESRA